MKAFADSRLSLLEKSTALRYLGSSDARCFAELVLELQSRDPTFLVDESFLRFAVSRKPEAFLSRLDGLRNSPDFEGLLSLALVRCDEPTYRTFLNSTEGSRTDASRMLTLRIAGLGRDRDASCEGLVALLRDPATLSQQSTVLDILAQRGDIVTFLLDPAKRSTIPQSMRFPLIEKVFQAQGDLAERRIRDFCEIPGFHALLPRISENSIAPRAAIDFERKVRDVFPHLSHEALNTVACALASRNEATAALLSRHAEIFRSCPDAFITLAARQPGEFARNRESLLPVVTSINPHLLKLCDSYAVAASTLTRFQRLSSDELRQVNFEETMRLMLPPAREVFLLGLANAGAAQREFLLAHAEAISKEPGGFRALDFIARNSPEALLQSETVRRIPHGLELRQCAEAFAVIGRCSTPSGLPDLEKIISLRVLETSPDQIRDRVSLWLLQSGEGRLLIENASHVGRTEIGTRLLGEAVFKAPAVALRNKDRILTIKDPWEAAYMLLNAALAVPGEGRETYRLLQTSVERQGARMPYTLPEFETLLKLKEAERSSSLQSAAAIIDRFDRGQLLIALRRYEHGFSPGEANAALALALAAEGDPALREQPETGKVWTNLCRQHPSLIVDQRERIGNARTLASAGYHFALLEATAEAEGKPFRSLSEGGHLHATGGAIESFRTGYRQAQADIRSLGTLADSTVSHKRFRFLEGVEGFSRVSEDWFPAPAMAILMFEHVKGSAFALNPIQGLQCLHSRIRDVSSIAYRNIMDRGVVPGREEFRVEFAKVVAEQQSLDRVHLFTNRQVTIWTSGEPTMGRLGEDLRVPSAGQLPVPNFSSTRSVGSTSGEPYRFARRGLVEELTRIGARNITVIREEPFALSQTNTKDSALRALRELPKGGMLIAHLHGNDGFLFLDGGEHARGQPPTSFLSDPLSSWRIAQAFIDRAKEQQRNGIPYSLPLEERSIVLLHSCGSGNTIRAIAREFKILAEREGIPLDAMPILISTASPGQDSYSSLDDRYGSQFFRALLNQGHGVRLSAINGILPPQSLSNPSVIVVERQPGR